MDPDKIPIQMRAVATKQRGPRQRLTGMHAPMRHVAVAAVRTGLMVVLAMLLILGLLPAVLAVQAAST